MLFGVTAALFLAACGAWAQDDAYPDARQLVQRVQDDLRHIMQEDARNHKQEDHVEGALKHLSDFDKGLANNRFDKDRRDAAIEDLRHLRVDRGNM
jgi:succinate dehydrogenase/fumarate reductase flavoprotein subunit